MNCRRVQDLLAPYVDERLTGEQMLDIRRHLDVCRSCAEEYMVQRQVKTLLGSVGVKEPGHNFEARLRSQIDAERRAGLSLSMPAFSLTNRGRRLAYAMALSCVSILSLAHATSTKMALTDMPMPSVQDAQTPAPILTDLQGESITTAFRSPAEAPQAGFFAVRPRDDARRAYNFVGGFSSPVNVFPSAGNVSFAGYPMH